VHPIGFRQPLRDSLKGHGTLRVSDYGIEAAHKKVIIVAIKHRKEIYQDI